MTPAKYSSPQMIKRKVLCWTTRIRYKHVSCKIFVQSKHITPARTRNGEQCVARDVL